MKIGGPVWVPSGGDISQWELFLTLIRFLFPCRTHHAGLISNNYKGRMTMNLIFAMSIV
jgi:hypothetical protein